MFGGDGVFLRICKIVKISKFQIVKKFYYFTFVGGEGGYGVRFRSNCGAPDRI